MNEWKSSRDTDNGQEGYYVGLMNACGYRCFSCGTCSMYGTANTMGVFAEVIGLYHQSNG